MTSATISSCTQSWILSLAHFSSDSQATLDELRRLVVFSFMAVSPSVGPFRPCFVTRRVTPPLLYFHTF